MLLVTPFRCSCMVSEEIVCDNKKAECEHRLSPRLHIFSRQGLGLEDLP